MPTLNWIGKDAVRNHHHEVPFRLLREDPDRAVGDPDADNLLVQGDNLIALKALLPYYAGQVKCVYNRPAVQHGQRGLGLQRQCKQPADAPLARSNRR